MIFHDFWLGLLRDAAKRLGLHLPLLGMLKRLPGLGFGEMLIISAVEASFEDLPCCFRRRSDV